MQQMKLVSGMDSRVLCIYGNETDKIRRTASHARAQQPHDGGSKDDIEGADKQRGSSTTNEDRALEGSLGSSRASSPRQSPRDDSRPASARRRAMRQLVKEAIGHIAIDSKRENLFYTAEGCVRVRRVVKVDGLVEPGCAASRTTFYNENVRSCVEGIFTQDRDVVMLVGGDSSTSKTGLIHGQTLEVGAPDTDVPPREQWGIAQHVVEHVLQRAKDHPCEVTVTACRVHQDHIADALVSSSGVRMTRSDAKKSRNQYSRLLAISSTAALELEEVDGRFAVQDQIDCTIRELPDFSHVTNCFAALNSGKVYLRMGTRKASPFHFVLSIRIWRIGHDEPRFIHLVEMADTDYESPVPEETAAFRALVALVPEIAVAINTRNAVKLKSLIRNSTLTRVCMGNIDLEHTDLVVVHMAKFSHAMQTMEYLAKCKQVGIRIVLHGPDGEGEGDVDPELRQHVQEIQQRCEELAKDIAFLEEEKAQMLERIGDGKNALSKLEQQHTIVRGLASTNVLKKREAAPEVRDASRGQSVQAAAATRNVLRLQALERDIRSMKEEDQRRAEATEQQVRFMNAERQRCMQKTQVLQKELDALRTQLEQQDAEFAREKAAIESEMATRMQDTLDSCHQELEVFNNTRRLALELSSQASTEQQQRAAAREREVSNGERLFAESVAVSLAEENDRWAAEHAELEAELATLQRQRAVLETEKRAVDAAFERELKDHDVQAAALSEYANKMSKLIWRLEGHNSSESRRLLTTPKCGVQIFDPTTKHTSEWFESRCIAMRKWLDERGFPRPAVFYNVETGVAEVLDVNAAKVQQQPVRASHGVQTDPVPVVRTPKDYTGILAKNLSATEHSLRIVTESQKRLRHLREQRTASTSPSPSRSIAASTQWEPSPSSAEVRSRVTVAPIKRPQSAAFRRPQRGSSGSAD